MFKLHKDFENKTTVCDMDLSVLLLDDAKEFVWLILVPKVESAVELVDLSVSDQQRLLNEINICSRVLQQLFNPDKLNIAMLGNVTPQLHCHVIARFKTDEHFPKPVFGLGSKKMNDDEKTQKADLICKKLKTLTFQTPTKC